MLATTDRNTEDVLAEAARQAGRSADAEVTEEDLNAPLDMDFEDPAQKAEIETKLKAALHAYEQRKGMAFVDLIYAAGPYLSKAYDQLGKADYAAFCELAVGYAQTTAWTIRKTYETFPEATHRRILERLGGQDNIHQVVTAPNPIEWVMADHYVPRLGKYVSVFEMTTRDIRMAKKHEKALASANAAGQAMADAQEKTRREPSSGGTNAIDATHMLAAISVTDSFFLGWHQLQRFVPSVTPNAEQLKQLREFKMRVMAIVEDVDTMVKNGEDKLNEAVTPGFSPPTFTPPT